ncbi:hypothetical protein N7456_012904 [Penicillium angulare]|uniref:Major facilitator superfamily (MFS) profile domain-containing protein n=1 Tax=Penicillium angulare TaxID=116970 RepID=A0A9W9JWA7_9EURO|nr:hypothetical protein N7456_012904 [Penicillium angulare]
MNEDLHPSQTLPNSNKNTAAVQEQIVIPVLTEEQMLLDRKVLWKIDLLILPLCTLNYFFSAMDRSDIGNAKIAGFKKDNHLSATQFSTTVSLFYAGYIVCQPIGGLLIQFVEAFLLLGIANIAWGICTIMLLFSKGMVLPGILRVLIGATEGLTQINTVFLTMWYTKDEIAVRTGLWYSFGSLAAAFNGLIAWGIQHNIHSSIFKSWQLLFLIEGAFPITFAPFLIYFYPSSPANVKKFFTEEEKRLCISRSQRAGNTIGRAVNPREAFSVFYALETYGMFIAYFCVIWSSSGYGNFLPAIVKGLGFSAVKSQLLTVPICFLGFISVNFWCYISDRLQIRGPLIIGLAMVAMIGFTILTAISSAKGPRIFALCLISCSVQPLIPLALSFLFVNTAGLSRRALLIPIQNACGQVGGLAVSYTYVDGPRYLKGTIATILCLVLLMVMVGALDLYFLGQNRVKAASMGSRRWQEDHTKSFDELGTDHPDFFFTL